MLKVLWKILVGLSLLALGTTFMFVFWIALISAGPVLAFGALLIGVAYVMGDLFIND